MKQDSKRFSSILFAGLLLAGALIVYFEFIVPAYSNLQELKGQEQSEVNLYNNEKAISDKVSALIKTLGTNSSTSDAVAMALPVGQNLAGAIAQIYGLASNSGVTAQSAGIGVQAVQAPTNSGSTTGGTLTQAATTGSVIKPTGSISIQLTGSGSYENIKTFLQGLENNIRIFDVTGLSFQPSAANGVHIVNPDLYTFNITATTYYQAQ